jgi:putative ABC transport system substrate-binding protein
MDRRHFLLTSLAGALIAPVAAETQQASKVYRIGWLAPDPRSARNEPFFHAMRELGYVKGQTLMVEYRHGPYERFADLARQLVDLKPDVLVALTPQASLAVKAATATVPIVFFSSDPVAAGIVSNLARLEGNLTGI